MAEFSKGPSRPSRSTEYKKRLAELEDFIAKNRLVSKEAQMSSMSGEGYTDPRFFKTTGNPLIDQYGMRPFPAEGSGQILSTTDLGMSGKKELFNIGNPGKYRPIADTIVYKDISDLYKNTDLTPVTPETTQKHEFFHRAAQRSGWINNFHNSPYLKKNVKLLSGENGRILKPLINEAVAHSYEYDKDYSKDKELKKEINFRASKFNLKDPKKIADEIFDNIEYLRDDFEKYLEEVTVEYLPENVNSYTTTRTNKATGGEANNLQAALDMLQKPVPNIIKTPEEKETPKLIGEGGILFDYTDPVDVGLTALGFTGVGTATALSIKAARLAAKLKKLETFKKLPLYHGGFLPSKNALKIKGVDVFYASPSYKIAERYNPVNPENIKLTGKTPKELYKTNRQPGVFEMQPPNKFAVLDKPDKIFKKDIKDYLGYLKSQQKQIIKDNKDYAIKNYGNRPDFNPTNKYYLPTNKLDDLRNLDFKVKDLTRYLKNPKKYDTTAGLGYGYQTGSGVLDALKAKNYDAVLTNQAFTRLSSPKSKFKKIDEAEIASDQVVFLKPMGAKKVSTKQLKKEFEDLSLDDFLQNPPDWYVKKATGGEATNLQAALNMLQNPVTSSISPLGDPTLSPLMESLQKNPIDDFAMMMADPTKVGLKVINTPIKMQFKKLFAARGKFQQLVDKQKFKYDRGLDLASKADPKDIAQGTLQAHVALKSGKRFQKPIK
jgi:ribosomal protein L13